MDFCRNLIIIMNLLVELRYSMALLMIDSKFLNYSKSLNIFFTKLYNSAVRNIMLWTPLETNNCHPLKIYFSYYIY